jgi:hypothetical protein
VTVTDEPEEPAKKPDEEVQVTDDKGNPVNEKWIRIGK